MMKLILGLIVIFTITGLGLAKIYKCIGANGSTNYSEQECPQKQHEEKIKHFKQAREESGDSSQNVTTKKGVSFYTGAKIISDDTEDRFDQKSEYHYIVYLVEASRNKVIAFYKRQKQVINCNINDLDGNYKCEVKKTRTVVGGFLMISKTDEKDKTRVFIDIEYIKQGSQ